MRNVHIDRSVPVSCDRDCGAGCPLQADVSDSRLVRNSVGNIARSSTEG
jgi:hypothetical protein